MSELNLQPPSGNKIAMATIAAAVLATIVLVTTVLPAEYGIDPTGTGELLGLTAMRQPARTLEIADPLSGNEGIREVEIPDFGDPVPLPNPEIHQDHPQPPQTRTMEVLIPGGGEAGTEIKMVMREGDLIVYSWQVDQGTIYSDFHGHDPLVGNEFWVRYMEHQEGSGQSGSVVVPFNGEHGWYWLNYNEFPVTVTLTLTGFFEDIVDYGIF